MASSLEEQQQSTTPLKLRDSCDACAASKLKCTKEKPTCSRCAKKEINCSYVATKRKGRKSSSQSSQSTTTRERQKVPSEASPGPSVTNPALDPLDRLDMWFTADTILPLDDYLTHSSSYSLPSDGLMPMQLSDLMTDGDDSFPLLATSFTPDVSNGDFINEHDSFFTDIGQGKDDSSGFVGSLSFFENSIMESALPPDIETPITNEAPKSQKKKAESCCMSQVMAFMKQVFSNSSNSCESSEAMDICDPSTTQDLPATNQKTIEVVGDILNCSCSQDGFILVMISLILLRLLERYAAAARQPHLWRSNPSEAVTNLSPLNFIHQTSPRQALSTSVTPEELDEEDPGYMAAQRVLSELHYVQRLVNQLSTRLQEHSAMSSGVGALRIPGPIQEEHMGSSLPLSLGLFNQLNTDIRRRLKSLAREVVTILRRE